MKINRAKLNTLLKSGLNPEVKTRKHLAAHLGLDPTTLTRWFASRDRLGNPRYPVVPDRHVANILKIFGLKAESLELSEEELRLHCLDMILVRTEENDEAKQKAELRLENIASRKLTLLTQPSTRRQPIHIISLIVIVFIAVFIWWYYQSQSETVDLASDKSECWTGYSDSLGEFDEPDKADPCHYGKLFHNALEQLKASNDLVSNDLVSNGNGLSPQVGKVGAAEEQYVLFLTRQLEQRKTEQQIELNIELGRWHFNRSKFGEALLYFKKAEKIISSSATQNAQLKTKLSHYVEQALKADIASQKHK